MFNDTEASGPNTSDTQQTVTYAAIAKRIY